MRRGRKKNLPDFQELSESTVQTELTQRTSRKTILDELKKRKKEEESKKPTGPVWPVYKKFFAYTTKRWKIALGCLILSIISGAITSIFPWQLGILLDVVTKQTTKNQDPDQFHQALIRHMIQLGLITLAMGLFTFFRYISLQLFQQTISIDLKTDIFSTFIKNDVNFFEIYKSGELISRLNNDINQAKSAISNNLTFLIRNIVNIIGTLIVLFVMSWRLTFIVLTIVPIYAFVTLQYTQKAKKLVKQKQDIEAQISVHIGEKFGGIQIIKSYCCQEQQIKKYKQYNQASYDLTQKRTLYQGIQMTCSQVLPSFGSMLVLFYAGIRLLNGTAELSAGQLTSFILYCSNLSNTTSGISNSYTNIVNGASAIQKVFQMMNYERLIDEDTGQSIDINGDIKFEDVEFKYPRSENNIFNGINFEVKSGEFVAFVGQSGSGKSTITKLLEHFYKINGGKIFFSGRDTSELNIKYLRQQIGLVNQEATIFSGTIQQNITYGLPDYSLEELEIAAKKSGCLEFINNRTMFPEGFHTVVGERGLNLSGGQRQRISIARALMRKPKILIFDEATSALDSHSEAMVQKSIEQLADNHNITIIVVAHRLSTVIRCDRLYVMKQGEILESGSHKQLIQKHGYYYELIQKQLQGKFDEDVPVKQRRISGSVLSDEAPMQEQKKSKMILEKHIEHSFSAPKQIK